MCDSDELGFGFLFGVIAGALLAGIALSIPTESSERKEQKEKLEIQLLEKQLKESCVGR